MFLHGPLHIVSYLRCGRTSRGISQLIEARQYGIGTLIGQWFMG